jgi:hypothetical protein
VKGDARAVLGKGIARPLPGRAVTRQKDDVGGNAGPAFFSNALFGSHTAPTRAARCDKYCRAPSRGASIRLSLTPMASNPQRTEALANLQSGDGQPTVQLSRRSALFKLS